jgi:8-oxo-dGTP pyrophosphatase MutT (NUDIX family)
VTAGVSFLSAGDPQLTRSGELDDVVSLLEEHRARLGQPDVVDEMRRFAADHPDALHRSCAAGHFTGSAAVVDAAGERVVVLFHRKAQRWLQPGGHADGDANLASVALREATEETGIGGLAVAPAPVDVDIHRVHFPDAPPHLHLDVRFVVRAPAGAAPVANHESAGVRWVTLDELESLDTDGSVVRLATRALAGWTGGGVA